MRNCGFLGAALVALAVLPVAPQSSQSEDAVTFSAGQNTSDIQQGRQLFLADGCSECHGTVGQGGMAGPRVAPNPMGADAIARYIRDPHGEMPPYSVTVLDDRGVQQIQSYLASLPQPPAPASTPALSQQ
jgi:mono/diheme cytochrome c family protein